MNKIPRKRLIAAIDNELVQRTLFENYKEPDGSWDSHRVAEYILSRIEHELLMHLVDENRGYAVVQEKED